MRDDTAAFDVMMTVQTVAPNVFAREVDRFRAIVENPAVPMAEKARAWDAIVRGASQLDSKEVGFACAGVVLKQALCLWLDVRRTSPDRA